MRKLYLKFILICLLSLMLFPSSAATITTLENGELTIKEGVPSYFVYCDGTRSWKNVTAHSGSGGVQCSCQHWTPRNDSGYSYVQRGIHYGANVMTMPRFAKSPTLFSPDGKTAFDISGALYNIVPVTNTYYVDLGLTYGGGTGSFYHSLYPAATWGVYGTDPDYPNSGIHHWNYTDNELRARGWTDAPPGYVATCACGSVIAGGSQAIGLLAPAYSMTVPTIQYTGNFTSLKLSDCVSFFGSYGYGSSYVLTGIGYAGNPYTTFSPGPNGVKASPYASQVTANEGQKVAYEMHLKNGIKFTGKTDSTYVKDDSAYWDGPVPNTGPGTWTPTEGSISLYDIGGIGYALYCHRAGWASSTNVLSPQFLQPFDPNGWKGGDDKWYATLSLEFGSMPTVIDGGTYCGSPAVVGSNINVLEGTFVNYSNTKSNFVVDKESKIMESLDSDGTTFVQYVELKNPPVNIDWSKVPPLKVDWSDFPYTDFTAPTIEVVRDPVSQTTPTKQVKLTIRAIDAHNNNHATPISVNGGAYQASGTVFTFTENQTVDITARDSLGNTRQYSVRIENIDTNAPTINSISQANTAWTSEYTDVYVQASDDIKLHATPYRYSLKSSATGQVTTTDWTANSVYRATENGVLTVTVRDTLGATTSSTYEVRNIDKIKPSLSATIDPPAGSWAAPSNGVRISLEVNNVGDPVTGDGSPLPASAVRWGSNGAWTSDYSKVVYANGTYEVYVRDSVGNVSDKLTVVVNNINSTKPIVNGFEQTGDPNIWTPGPVILEVDASSGAGLDDRPYSWDNGLTWVSNNTFEVTSNGEYTVLIRDTTGNITEDSVTVSNIDTTDPSGDFILFKGLPEDGSGSGPDDFVWKLKVEASDLSGSGISKIVTKWDNQEYIGTNSVTQDIFEAGTYIVEIYDNVGNMKTIEKTITWDELGMSPDSSVNVGIEFPSTGTAGAPFNDNLANIVFSATGGYNKVTNTFVPYPVDANGVPISLSVHSRPGRYLTGYVLWDGVKYPVAFNGDDDGVGNGASTVSVTGLIPSAALTKDVQNGRLNIVIQEWSDSACTQLEKEGAATLYTSVQVTPPKINYTYSRDTGELTMVATSPVAGIKSKTYVLDSGAAQNYTAPFMAEGYNTIVLTAVDNVQNITSVTLDGTSLSLNGSGGGTLPTEEILPTTEVNAYYIAGRSSEAYIIGGTRTNTDSVPASEVLSTILGS